MPSASSPGHLRPASSATGAGASSSGSGGVMASPSLSKRAGKSRNQLTANEKRIWQTVLEEKEQTCTTERLQAKCPELDAQELMSICNSLLSKSLLSAQTPRPGILQFVAFSRSEASTMGQLEGDEGIFFSFIRESGNEGIWTKQLKGRANMHQTVMSRCLKTLEGKGLIKAVKSVKYPTRKIYMLANLTPSIELSGGPWYTDNELDSVFIDQLCTCLHQYVAAKTWPSKSDARDPSRRPVYPASHTQSLPTAASCLEWLRKSNITDTDLQVDNVQSLLDVLVYDGKIEKIPFVRLGRMDDDADYAPRKKRSRRKAESDSESAVSILSRSDERDSESVSDSDDSDHSHRSRKRKRRSRDESKSKRASRKSGSNLSKHARARHGSSKSRHKDSSNAKSIRLSDEDTDDDSDDDDDVAVEQDERLIQQPKLASSVHVYRAVRQVHVETGWIEVPCAHCPVFDFCQPGGPVNAEACLYLRDWIKDCSISHAKQSELETDEDMHRHNGTHTNGVSTAITYEDAEADETEAAGQSMMNASVGGDEEEDGFEEV